MAIDAYIKDKQPLVYRTFCHALESDRLAHAYLLFGESGTPLKETAVYLAKTILCDHPNPFADLTCHTCERIDANAYPDFILVDGSASSIKKDDVSEIISGFGKTALERKGIMVYIIHEVENMTVEAINSILKFLEEPSPNTFAILTTRNEAKVLPTILSRCEEIRLLLAPRDAVVEEAKGLGVQPDDADILSFFHNDASLILEYVEEDEYQNAKAAFLCELEAIGDGKEFARFAIEKDVTPLVNSKKTARYFFDMMALAFQDASSFIRGGDINLKSIRPSIEGLTKTVPSVDNALMAIMTMRGEIESNINLGLLLTHLIYVIFKE